MHDGVGPPVGERLADGSTLVEVARHERGAGIDRPAVAFGEVVEDGDLVATIEELFDADAADVTGPPRDKDVHVAADVIGPRFGRKAKRKPGSG